MLSPCRPISYAPWPKVRRLQASLESWADRGSQALEPLWAALADEQIVDDTDLPQTGISIEMERRLSASFVRGEVYGTRASTVILIDHAGQGRIIERRFDASSACAGQTQLHAKARLNDNTLLYP